MSSDLINRQALCDDLREYKIHPIPISSDESEVKGYNDGIDLAISVIAEFSSAEPEQKWIPVSEALPENNNDVLLQFPSNMGVGYFEDGYWCIVTGEDLYCGLDDDEEKPVAWMPLPEPWRGEE